MDIEKLIEQLNGYFEGKDLKRGVALDGATALSTLQAENEKLRAGLNDLRTQWDMYGGDEGITSTFAELEQARAEITRLKHYEDKCHDCPIVCAKREIIKAHEELEAVQNELEQKSKLIAQQAAELERRDKLLKEQETELDQMKRENETLKHALQNWHEEV